MEASGFGMPIRAASCCSTALESKYSNHAAASCHKPGTKQDTEKNSTKKNRHIRSKWDYQREEAQGPNYTLCNYWVSLCSEAITFLPSSKWNMNVNMKHSLTNKSGKNCSLIATILNSFNNRTHIFHYIFKSLFI